MSYNFILFFKTLPLLYNEDKKHNKENIDYNDFNKSKDNDN